MKKKLKIGRFIIIAVLIYFVIVCISQQEVINSYNKEAAVYEGEIEKANEENSNLQDIKSNINSTEYIEQVAREKLGMYLPNEREYIDINN